MKTVYIVILLVGFILLGATESENNVSNIIGAVLFMGAGYKLDLFNDSEEESHVK